MCPGFYAVRIVGRSLRASRSSMSTSVRSIWVVDVEIRKEDEEVVRIILRNNAKLVKVAEGKDCYVYFFEAFEELRKIILSLVLNNKVPNIMKYYDAVALLEYDVGMDKKTIIWIEALSKLFVVKGFEEQ